MIRSHKRTCCCLEHNAECTLRGGEIGSSPQYSQKFQSLISDNFYFIFYFEQSGEELKLNSRQIKKTQFCIYFNIIKNIFISASSVSTVFIGIYHASSL